MRSVSVLRAANRMFRRLGMQLQPARSSTEGVMDCVAGDLARARIGAALDNAQSQLGQDVFALLSACGKTPGFFVEFGAGDGKLLSNSYLLETAFNWKGILAEPNPLYTESLRLSRTALLDSRCVSGESGLTVRMKQAGYLTSMESSITSDRHARSRIGASGGWFTAETVSLFDLLEENKAPHDIDFLSIDTEGSEWQILHAFPWNTAYRIHAIAVEHNYTTSRSDISDLLLANGYVQVGREVSKHDDWYVRL